MTINRNLFVNMMLGVASIGVILVLAELSLRLMGYSAPICRRTDPALGWTLQPGCEGYVRLENINYSSVNEQGRNDDPLPPDKPESTFRIAFLGDSFTQASEVARSSNFVSLVRGRLGQAPPAGYSRVEALNFGVVGYGTTQQYLVLEREVLRYAPDLVVLVMYLGNDVSDNEPDLAESLAELRPYFTVKGGGVAPLPGFPRTAGMWRDQALIDVINLSRGIQWAKETAMGRAGRSHGPAKSDRKPRRLDGVFSEPTTPEWSRAWAAAEALVEAIAARAEASGARFLLVTAPDPIRFHPDASVRDDFAARLGLDSLDYPDLRIAELARRNGYPHLRLAGPLAEKAERGRIYFSGFDDATYGDGHWNEEGHREVSELLGAQVLELVGRRSLADGRGTAR